MRGRLLWIVIVSLCFLGLVGGAAAQTSQGGLTGTITDPSGASVPGAKLTLTQKATNAQRVTSTNADGIYRFDGVNLGTYTLQVTAAGFGSVDVTGIGISNAVSNVNVKLKLASGAQTVSVEAGADILPTATAPVRGGNFDTTPVVQLPVPAADPINLMLLLPGVQNASTTQFSDGSNNYSVNGERARSNNFMIDGVENNDISIAGPAFTITNQDALQEVAVKTSNFSAEYGRAGGAVINEITKSGTNAFHGTAYEVYQGNALDATSNDDRLNGLAHPSRFVENTPSFTVGGPVYIPGIYDGRNKTFFFAAGQWDRQFSTATKGVLAPNVGPTGVGVLQALAPQCANVALYLKALGGLTGNGLSNQTISIAAPDATSACNGDPRTGQSVVFSTAVRSASQSSIDANHQIRIDQIVSDKQTMSFRWLYDGNTTGPSFNNLPGFDRGFTGNTLSALFSDTYVFGPRWTNEFRFNFGRINFNFPSLAPDAFHADLPNFAISGITGFGVATNIPQFRDANNWQFQDTISATYGRHTLRFGGDFLRQTAKQAPPFNQRGSFSYAASGTAATGITSALANFIDDFGGSNGQINRQFGNAVYLPDLFRQAYFFEDEFKATSALTLNLGLRYENFGQPANIFKIPAFTNYSATNFATPNKVNPDNNNFGPAVGFAWAPQSFLGWLGGNNQMVWRGGFQVSYDAQFNNLLSNIAGSSPNTLGGLIVSPTIGRGTAAFQSQLATIQATPPTAQSPQTSLLDPNIRNPYTERWSLGFERQLARNTAFELSYVGTAAHKLYQTLDVNPIVNAATGARFQPQVGQRTERCSCANSNYNAMQFDFHHRYSPTMFGSLLFDASYTWSHYIDDSSEVFATNSTPSSFQSLPQVLGFSPNIDRGDSDNDRRQRTVFDAVWNLPGPTTGLLGRVVGGWELAPVTQLVTGAPYTITAGADRNGDGQSGPDRPDIGNPNAPLDTRGILGTKTCPTNLLEPDTGACVSASAVRWISGAGTLLGLPNANTVGRNTLRTPFSWTQDLNLLKSVQLTEKTHLEYRVEVFNLFNRENFSTPVVAANNNNDASVLNTPAPAPGSPIQFLNFGQTSAPGRTMRMGIKLLW